MDNKPQARWFEVAMPTHAERIDFVTGMLAELGVSGTEVRESRPGAAEIVFYLEAESAQAAHAEACGLIGSVPALAGLDLEVRGELASELWTENWRKHFVPLRVGRALRIVPPWEPADEPGCTTIVVNPGGAFGTGQHETTWLCLEAIEKLARHGSKVADLGCGSGILAIAAAKLGAARVLATDVDPAAIDATRENAVANGVADRVETLLAAAPPDERGAYDLVVANIYSDTLVSISGAIAAIAAPHAIVVLSGIETTRSAEVESAFTARGFALDEFLTRGEWSALVFRRSRA
jgi:ribosomal protein L11 methyltransferase